MPGKRFRALQGDAGPRASHGVRRAAAGLHRAAKKLLGHQRDDRVRKRLAAVQHGEHRQHSADRLLLVAANAGVDRRRGDAAAMLHMELIGNTLDRPAAGQIGRFNPATVMPIVLGHGLPSRVGRYVRYRDADRLARPTATENGQVRCCDDKQELAIGHVNLASKMRSHQ